MTFDLVQFLSERGVYYRTSGENCKRGHIVIDCPFCIAEGRGDTGQHMGIEIATGAWGCWRSAAHRGRSPVYLIAKLINCTLPEAAKLVHSDVRHIPEKVAAKIYTSDNIYDVVEDEVAVTPEVITEVTLPDEFELLSSRSPAKFVDYLVEKRGFRIGDIDELCEVYDLYYATSGDFADRIIIPVYVKGVLTSFTGRHVGHSRLRYRSLEKAKSVIPIFDSLGNYDVLVQHPGPVAIVEGPFDMLKLDFYGKAYGLRAGCIFSKTFSELKSSYVLSLRRTATQLVWTLDSAELSDMMSLSLQFPGFKKITFFPYPEGVKDPGELTIRQIAKSCRKFIV